MGSWTFSSLTLSITSSDFLSLVSCLQALWGSSSSLMFLLFPVSSFSLRLTIWAVHLMRNSFTLSRPMRFLKCWFVKANFMKSKYYASNCSYWWLCISNMVIVFYRKNLLIEVWYHNSLACMIGSNWLLYVLFIAVRWSFIGASLSTSLIISYEIPYIGAFILAFLDYLFIYIMYVE